MSKQVLVVEDEFKLANVLQDYLQAAGMMMAMKHGIALDTLQRPLRRVAVENWVDRDMHARSAASTPRTNVSLKNTAEAD